MKKIHFFILALFASITLVSCNDDDEFYNSVYLDIPELVKIEVPGGGYAVNDNLNFSIDFSRYLAEPGQTTPLDLFKTSGATSFGFAYYLERKDGSVWKTVFPNQDEFRIGDIVYVSATETYEFDESYPLAVAGEYRFRLEPYDGNKLKTNLVSRNDENKTLISIITSADNIDSEGYYYFDVN
ncbi:hypothetical protein [Flavobacterium sp.]|uniref:hypothetical protein n=1 Tax=Flavobacterium sp. TaxID=239 RepID=UPI0028BE0029|nr:hypothetical protein [Flavobacterium sp.]